MPRPAQCLFWLLAVLVVNSGCNSTIKVHIDGLTPEVKALGVTVRVNGKLSEEGDLILDTPIADFDIRIRGSAQGSGNVEIVVAGLDATPPTGQVVIGAIGKVALNQGGSVDVSLSLKRQRICSNDNWCWENPLPQGNALAGVWGSDAKDV